MNATNLTLDERVAKAVEIYDDGEAMIDLTDLDAPVSIPRDTDWHQYAEKILEALPKDTKVAYICGAAPGWLYLHVAHRLADWGIEELYYIYLDGSGATLVCIYDHRDYYGSCRPRS